MITPLRSRLKRIDEDESGYVAKRGPARQRSPLVTRLVPISSDEHLNLEESELVEAGFVRLPDESLPDSFWEMPAPRVSLADAISAVTSERDND